MSKRMLSLLVLFAGLFVAACENMPGKDGRYATRGGNRGEANVGLPVTPYEPK